MSGEGAAPHYCRAPCTPGGCADGPLPSGRGEGNLKMAWEDMGKLGTPTLDWYELRDYYY